MSTSPVSTQQTVFEAVADMQQRYSEQKIQEKQLQKQQEHIAQLAAPKLAVEGKLGTKINTYA